MIKINTDQKILMEKLTQSNLNFESILGKNMMHIWPLLPIIKEGKLARERNNSLFIE